MAIEWIAQWFVGDRRGWNRMAPLGRVLGRGQAELAAERPREGAGAGEAKAMCDGFDRLPGCHQRMCLTEDRSGSPGHRRQAMSAAETADEMIRSDPGGARDLAQGQWPPQVAFQQMAHPLPGIGHPPRRSPPDSRCNPCQQSAGRLLHAPMRDITRTVEFLAPSFPGCPRIAEVGPQRHDGRRWLALDAEASGQGQVRLPKAGRSIPAIFIGRFTRNAQQIARPGTHHSATMAGPQAASLHQQQLAAGHPVTEVALAFDLPAGGEIDMHF